MYLTQTINVHSLTEFLTRHHSFIVRRMKEINHVHTVSKKVLWIIAYYVLDTAAIQQMGTLNSKRILKKYVHVHVHVYAFLYEFSGGHYLVFW